MAPNERARVEELLKEVTDAMKALKTANGNTPDENESILYREAMKLRRQLAEDEPDPILSGSESSHGGDCCQGVIAQDGSAAVALNATAVEGALDDEARPPSAGPLHPTRQFKDATLHPVLRLLVVGVCALAWVISPESADSAVAMSLLMFLRFVPIFVMAGDLCGRAVTGTVIGMGLFFALLCARSLSVVLWDFPLPKSGFELVRHTAKLSDILYLFGLVGLLICGAATLAVRREKHHVSRRYLRWAMQVFVIVQTALVVELGYSALEHFAGKGRHHVSPGQTSPTVSHLSTLRH